jgi:tetratricopeptide (TPR) repeat protein
MAARPVPLPQPPIPRYNYQWPSKPAPGNRRDAEHYFVQGLKAQRDGRPVDAIAAYRTAILADPSYFEAHYNLGLAAYDAGNWTVSLNAYETALALTPESINARYNFALVLKQSGYSHDAASELESVLKAKPNETRAHLTLANLYAQQLNELKQAREHYLKVLELDPRHPQAASIRSWLTMNPPPP